VQIWINQVARTCQCYAQGKDVFTIRHGTPIEPRNFQRSWQTRCGRANVTPITVHDARRTGATLLADLDVHPRVAMQLPGTPVSP
jgi:integrase